MAAMTSPSAVAMPRPVLTRLAATSTLPASRSTRRHPSPSQPLDTPARSANGARDARPTMPTRLAVRRVARLGESAIVGVPGEYDDPGKR